MQRTILHCDMNNFFASAECSKNPKLRNIPLAVSGDAELRHGIILAKNNIAKAYGIKTAEPIWQAKMKCPNLTIVPPDFDLYMKYSKAAREIYYNYTSKIEAFGIDENWLDVTASYRLFGDGEKIANDLRNIIKKELGLTISVGVSFNKVFAKLGSDLKKPDAVTVISNENFKEKIWNLPVNYLLFIGKSTNSKLTQHNIKTIGDLANANQSLLERLLGKNGKMLRDYANGYDYSPVSEINAYTPPKSISNSTTAYRDLVNEDDIKIVLQMLCESVSSRMIYQKLKCNGIQVHLRDTNLRVTEHQLKLNYAVSDSKTIFENAYKLFIESNIKMPLRSLGVRCYNLIPSYNDQISFDMNMENIEHREKIDNAIMKIRDAYGKNIIKTATTLIDEKLINYNLA